MLDIIHTPPLAIAQITLSTDSLNTYEYSQCQCLAKCNHWCVLQMYFGSVMNCRDLDQHFQEELVNWNETTRYAREQIIFLSKFLVGSTCEPSL